MKTVSLMLVLLAICTYTSYAFVGFDAGELMMYHMMSGMLGGQRGQQPPQGPAGASTDLGGQSQPPIVRSGGDLGLGNLMQMRMLFSMMN